MFTFFQIIVVQVRLRNPSNVEGKNTHSLKEKIHIAFVVFITISLNFIVDFHEKEYKQQSDWN